MIGSWTAASELRQIAAGTDTSYRELYDPLFLPDLIGSFEWWRNTAECFLRADGGYLAPEDWPFSDRLVSLEARFWEGVAPARARTAPYLRSADDATDQPAVELVRRYEQYRAWICGRAREVLPGAFCDWLAERP